MQRYMLDTDTASYLIRGGYPALDARVQAMALRRLCISVMTRYELLYGVALKPEAVHLNPLVSQFLARVSSLPFDDAAAAAFATLSANLKRTGTGMGTMDAMIASHALSTGAVIVTNNVKHFAVVPGLKLENWVEAR